MKANNNLVGKIRMKIIYLNFIGLAFNINIIFAQNISSFDPKISVPSSPEAALLGRFGDIPVGYYTGTAQISVPMYTISEWGLDIPIKLEYHSSGIKVEDEATWVGLGWNLSPEGTISREVRGKKDEEEIWRTFCNNGDPAFIAFQARFPLNGEYNTLYQYGRAMAPNECQGGTYEQDPYCAIFDISQGYRQPDIYSYNFAGYSGKFYINPDTQEVVLIDKKEDIFFEYDWVDGLTARTLDGNRFEFGAIETSTTAGPFNASGSTYKLTKIRLTNGKQITFNYRDEQTSRKMFTEYAEPNSAETTPGITINMNILTTNKKTLTSISTDNETVNFILDDREDVIPNYNSALNVKKLKQIDIISNANGKKVKSFVFGYSYFSYIPSGPLQDMDAYGKRLKLDNLKEIGYDSGQQAVGNKPPYQFDYDTSVTMPLKTSYSTDFWGYYNGKINFNQLPDLTYFDYPSMPQFSVINQSTPKFTYGYSGANRFTDKNFCGAYMLNKIIYPTGGITEFSYEPNTFTNQYIPDHQAVTQARKHIVCSRNNNNNGPDAPSAELFISETRTLKFLNTISHGFPVADRSANAVSINSVYYNAKIEITKVRLGVVTVLKTWQLSGSGILPIDFQNNGSMTWNESFTIEYEDSLCHYYVNVSFPLFSYTNPNGTYYGGAQAYTDIQYFDETGVDKTTSKQCGMRVKAIKNYSSEGIVVSNKIIKYYDGKLLNVFNPLSIILTNHSDLSYIYGGVSYEYIGFYKRITISSDDFGTNGGNLIGYGRVEEIDIANDVDDADIDFADNSTHHLGKKIYYYNNTVNRTKQGSPNIPSQRNGMIDREVVVNRAGSTVSDKKYFYEQLMPFTSFNAIKTVRQSFGNRVPCGYAYPANQLPLTYYYETFGATYPGSQYRYDVYPINSEQHVLARTKTLEYLNGLALTKEEVFTYNNQGKIKTSTQISDSDSIPKSTTYFYPSEHPENLLYEDTMLFEKIFGIPTVVEKRAGAELISKEIYRYSNAISVNSARSFVYKVFTKKSNISSISLEERMEYQLYESGNVLQYSMPFGKPVSIIWGYKNKFPVAKIENINYEDIDPAIINEIHAASESQSADAEDQLKIKLNNLRNSLNQENVMISTFTYKPLVGVSTITDPTNKSIFYNYDAYGRLLEVRDNENNILSETEYHFRPAAN